MALSFITRLFARRPRRQAEPLSVVGTNIRKPVQHTSLGIIAGSGALPLEFARGAKRAGCKLVAVCYENETDPAIESLVDAVIWIRLGQLGKLIDAFVEHEVTGVALIGGVNRVRAFDIKLDTRGASLIARLRSTKDDVIMRGVAEELAKEGIEVIASTSFLPDALAPLGVLTDYDVTPEEKNDIAVGVDAIRAMSDQDIGQVVVVKDGVVVAVEAIEGTDKTIKRAGELCGSGCVVVKCAKTTQDMRFDVPTVGLRTIQTMVDSGCRVLAMEAGRCIIMEREAVLALANRHKLVVLGIEPLVSAVDSEPSAIRQQAGEA